MDKCTCDYHGSTGSSHRSFCKLFGKVFGTYVQLTKEEPKPACDHIVGKAVFYYNIGEYETLECHVSELSKVKWKKEINRKRENTFVWHKHCHECGEKISKESK